jgi:amino-acid N-acetyltransferase
LIDYHLATAADREAIAALLDSERLPSSDLAASGVVLIAARSQERLAGCIGIEPHGDAGIIRSLAVAPEYRGRGIARSLVSRAEALALERGVRRLYLLTEGAAGFWRNAGYSVVPRSEAPAAIRASAEFASLCSASAACMEHLLSAPMDRS